MLKHSDLAPCPAERNVRVIIYNEYNFVSLTQCNMKNKANDISKEHDSTQILNDEL